MVEFNCKDTSSAIMNSGQLRQTLPLPPQSPTHHMIWRFSRRRKLEFSNFVEFECSIGVIEEGKWFFFKEDPTCLNFEMISGVCNLATSQPLPPPYPEGRKLSPPRHPRSQVACPNTKCELTFWILCTEYSSNKALSKCDLHHSR